MRRKLLILCYHGFEIYNESQFRPQIFIKRTTFERRLKALKKYTSAVIPLDVAVRALEDDSLPDKSVVITIDDGFYSVFSIAFPLLQQYNFPATVYQTTMDMQKEQPILHLLVPYMIKTTSVEMIDSDRYKWVVTEGLDLSRAQDEKKFTELCLSYAEKIESLEELERFCKELGDLLEIDYNNVRDSRLLTLMSESEVSMLASKGLDIQLHTHTHMPSQNDNEKVSNEIRINRQILEKLTDRPLVHFCYPSGRWSAFHFPVLKKKGSKVQQLACLV